MYPGNGCISKHTVVEPIEEKEEKKDNFDDVKRRHIEQTVNRLPLPRIIVLHRHAKTVDFAKYNMNPEDVAYFRECVQKRYDDNEDDINEIINYSNERYRRVVFAPKVQILNNRRNRRKTLLDKLPSQVERSKSSVSLVKSSASLD
jgi:hypothetical protein